MPSAHSEFEVVLRQGQSACELRVGDEETTDPCPTLREACLRAAKLLPQMVSAQLAPKFAGEYVESVVEIRCVEDKVPFFRLVFYNTAAPAPQPEFDVVLFNYVEPDKPPKLLDLGCNEPTTSETWRAACSFCNHVKLFFEKMLSAADGLAPPGTQGKHIFAVRDVARGDRALVSLYGF